MQNTPERTDLIEKIANFPLLIARVVEGLTVQQLTTHTLPGEWTIAQNIHHLADSHMNAYIRCKLIMSEERPELKPYDQDQWALFADATSADLSTSLGILTNLHARWTIFWKSLPEEAWSRVGLHPEIGAVSMAEQLRSYAEHGEAHIDQIRRTLAAGDW